MPRLARCAAVLLLVLISLPVHADTEKVAAGSVFALSKTSGMVKIYEQANETARTNTAANGTRLPFRKQMEGPNGITWYFVTPPGRPAGWVKAADITLTRPGETPPPKMIEVIDAGLKAERPSAAQTAAARGLSDQAKQYATEKQDFDKTVNQFLTLETTVEEYFGDKHDEKGDYPDITVEGRKQKAAAFKAALK